MPALHGLMTCLLDFQDPLPPMPFPFPSPCPATRRHPVVRTVFEHGIRCRPSLKGALASVLPRRRLMKVVLKAKRKREAAEEVGAPRSD